MSAAEAEKEIKYEIDLKDLPRAPDITMLGLGKSYPILDMDQLEYYDLFNLIKIAKLLGVTTETQLVGLDPQRNELKKNIESFLAQRYKTGDLRESLLYKPTNESGLIIVRELYANREMMINLYDSGMLVAFQVYSRFGRLLRMKERSEGLEIFRTFAYNDKIGSYTNSSEYDFEDINLSYRIDQKENKYYISYLDGRTQITKERYLEEWAKQMAQLRQFSQTALQQITQESIPLDRIIGEYLFPQ